MCYHVFTRSTNRNELKEGTMVIKATAKEIAALVLELQGRQHGSGVIRVEVDRQKIFSDLMEERRTP